MARALALLVCVDPFFKMIDYARHCRKVGWRTAGEYFRFLVPFPVFFVVFDDRGHRLASRVPAGPEIARIVGGAAVVGACFYAVKSGMAAVPGSFGLDHAVKLAVFVVLIESLCRSYERPGAARRLRHGPDHPLLLPLAHARRVLVAVQHAGAFLAGMERVPPRGRPSGAGSRGDGHVLRQRPLP